MAKVIKKAAKKTLPADTNKRAKSIVDSLTKSEDKKTVDPDISAAAAALGRKGGLIGGKARAEVLSPERRKEIAEKAAAARWGTKEDKED